MKGIFLCMQYLIKIKLKENSLVININRMLINSHSLISSFISKLILIIYFVYLINSIKRLEWNLWIIWIEVISSKIWKYKNFECNKNVQWAIPRASIGRWWTDKRKGRGKKRKRKRWTKPTSSINNKVFRWMGSAWKVCLKHRKL